jgi:hypothetical protein
MQSIKERQLLTAAVAAGVLGLLLLLILLDSNPAIESAQRLQVKG